MTIKDTIRAKALELGFDAVGFAPAHLESRHGAHLKDYVVEGRHGAMAWMETRQTERASPQGLWADAKSVIVLGTNYGPAQNTNQYKHIFFALSAYHHIRSVAFFQIFFLAG